MLIVDNYDSFTYNIVQYIRILGINPIIVKNDEYTLEEIKEMNFSKIIISPGWGNPDNAGISMEIIDYFQYSKPILGVCLGMQCIAKFFGGEIIKAPQPFHGKNSKIFFDEKFVLFKGLKQGFSATRYHSLMVKPNSNMIKITATTEDDIPMALEINNRAIYGVQFHPEAILTEQGIKIFENFLFEV